MIKLLNFKLNESNYEYHKYKNKVSELISILSKVSDILNDQSLVDFINEETNNYWNTPQHINDYIETLKSIIY